MMSTRSSWRCPPARVKPRGSSKPRPRSTTSRKSPSNRLPWKAFSSGSPAVSSGSDSMTQQYRVDSDVGKLRKVLVHRPDLSLRRLTPTNREELLFDDVLWVRKARAEHDRFVSHMEKRGVEVFYLDDLLTEVLKNLEARSFVIDKTVTRLTVGPSLVKEFRAYLLEMDPRRLATILIGGLAREEIDDSLFGKSSLTMATMDATDFLLPPLPNTIFTRDQSSWI